MNMLFLFPLVTATMASNQTGQHKVRRVDELLVKAFAQLPASESFVAQQTFLNEQSFEIILRPAGKRPNNVWSVDVSGNGRVVVKGEKQSDHDRHPLKAFGGAVAALTQRGLLRLPCRVSWSQNASGFLFQFAGLPLAPGDWLSVRVSEDGKHATVIPGH